MVDIVEIMERQVTRMKELRFLEMETFAYSFTTALRDYAVSRGMHTINWEDPEEIKFCINYNYADKRIEVFEITDMRDVGQAYFKTKEACNEAIELFRDDIIKFFSQWREQDEIQQGENA